MGRFALVLQGIFVLYYFSTALSSKAETVNLVDMVAKRLRKQSKQSKKVVGYHAHWTVNQELCAPDGFIRESCVTVYANATTSLMDFLALRDSLPTLRSSGRIRYLEERLPGPTIEVEVNQEIDIRVLNNQLQTGTTLHWHGILQTGTNFMDGVQGVTQCPISPSGEFRYKFTPTETGTYWYHSHMFGGQSSDGLNGPLIVHPPKDKDPYAGAYDSEIILMISDWSHRYSSSELTLLSAQYASRKHNDTASNLYANALNPNMARKGGFMPLMDAKFEATIINGKGRNVNNPEEGQTEIIHVKQGHTYRFRTICSSGGWTYNVSIESHQMNVIAVDGFDVQPYNAESYVFGPGNRVDFLFKADQPIGNYRLNAMTLNTFNGPAIIHYEGAPEPTEEEMIFGINGSFPNLAGCVNAVGCPGNAKELNIFLNSNQLKPAKKTPVPHPKNPKMYKKVNVTFAGGPFFNPDMKNPNYIEGKPYTWYLKINERPFSQFVLPKYPAALWKWDNVDPAWAVRAATTTTDFTSSSMKDKHGNDLKGKATYATNAVNVRLNNVVDIILNNPTKMAHPMHLHGHRFFVLGSGTNASYYDEQKHGSQLNKDDPIYIDTFLVPAFGWAVLRFKANNVGWWAFHCHIDLHFATGMVMAFNVGEKEQTPPPEYAGCNPVKHLKVPPAPIK